MGILYLAKNIPEAYLLKAKLDAAGIECRIENEHLQTLRWELPLDTTTGVSVVLIDQSRKNDAAEIVQTFLENFNKSNVSHSTWKCTKCGEEIEDQFTECWQCGTARVGA